MSELISTRIPEKLAKEIVGLAKLKHSGKSEFVRNLVLRGLSFAKLERAINLYRAGKVSVWKASEIAGVSLWKFVEEIKIRKISIGYGLKSAEEDVKAVFG